MAAACSYSVPRNNRVAVARAVPRSAPFLTCKQHLVLPPAPVPAGHGIPGTETSACAAPALPCGTSAGPSHSETWFEDPGSRSQLLPWDTCARIALQCRHAASTSAHSLGPGLVTGRPVPSPHSRVAHSPGASSFVLEPTRSQAASAQDAITAAATLTDIARDTENVLELV